MSEVVTTLTIDADTSGADRFTKAMDGAETASQRATNAVTGMWAAIGGATVVAAVAGISSALDQVAKLNKGLADINQNAKMAGLTLEKYQSYKFAANVSGVDDTKLNDGLQKSAALLNDAQRNANSLTKLFDANSLSIRTGNGDLISQNRLLDISANLMKKAATEQDKIKIAEMLGFTKQWVPFLEQGADAISRTASEAQAAGAVIDEATILKADEFDKAWRKSSTEWSAALKAAAVSVLPYIDDLITAAGKIFTKENIKGLAKPGQDAIAQVVPETLQLTFKPEAAQAFQDWRDGTATFLEAVKRLPVNPIEAVGTARPLTVGGEGPWQEHGPWLPQGWVKPVVSPLGPTTTIPANDVKADGLDRAIEQIEKHTARVEADTKAIGQCVAAMEKARTEAKQKPVDCQQLRLAA